MELASIADIAQHLIDEGWVSRGRNEQHGWELGGERAYLCDATQFDELSRAVKLSTVLSSPLLAELRANKCDACAAAGEIDCTKTCVKEFTHALP